MSDLSELKARLPEYLDRTGVRITRRSDTAIQARCPLHDDREPSFSATCKADGAWLWHCHTGCGGGTVIDLHANLHGLRPGSRQSIIGAAKVLCIILDDGPGTLTSAQRRANRHHRLDRMEERRREDKAKREVERITTSLREKREQILNPYLSDEWRADLWHDSFIEPPSKEIEQARALLTYLFHPDEILWLGQVKDSGKIKHLRNFRPARQWAACHNFPPRIAPGIFRKGSTSRSTANLARRPYLIIESDELIGHKPTTPDERAANKKLSAALFELLRHKFHLSLRAVIDTGGKSLHGWFDRPSDRALAALRKLADGLAIDRDVFDRAAAAPLRLPGCIHGATRTSARLLYLNPISQP